MEAKSKQKNSPGLPKNPPKVPGTKINAKKIPFGISVLFPKGIKDITEKVKTSEIKCLCFILVSLE